MALTVGVLMVAISIVCQFGASEPALRLTGLGLQLLGICIVAVGIRQTRSLFGHPSLIERALGWIGRFPVYGGRVVTLGGSVSIGAFTASGRGYVESCPRDATNDARIEALEANVQRLRDRITQAEVEADKCAQKLTQQVAAEQQDRATEDRKLAARLESAAAGGLHISAMGVAWLFAGVTLSTASPEIASWLR